MTFSSIATGESASGVQLQIILRENPIVLNGSPEESAGGVLCGVLMVTTTKRIKIKSLSLLFEGTSRIKVPRAESYQQTLVFHHEWTFLKQETQLHELTPDGVYEYPFELLLPGNLPVSVDIAKSEIKYQLKAVVERPSILRNIRVAEPVRIERVSSALADYVPCVTCSGRWANSLRYDARVAKHHYQPGELLAFEMFVEINKAIFCLTEISLSIIQVVNYSTQPDCYETKKLCHKSRKVPIYGANENLDYSMMIQIPPDAHADCHTELIELSHALMVKVKLIDKMKRKWWFYIDLPITVNTPTQWELSTSPPSYQYPSPPPYDEKPDTCPTPATNPALLRSL
ncbi:hypothetical protein K493DRAFT_302221 [Basidiobolus meristosporus CBS 931.73]|uniref:Arrestin C-terminal-like domain-containing protein n=1 Tax=Basidiobolus meristosporus CBS 931.73 TaxID=1314790 RepID=A0A1Y1Y825_9FUNG|nr:hypothetical protein K493DRAFT_302221 [Basidiobolus meristosporus CBS 931.73]|eukprot:ORX94153.1 hypothetical protein K493DRAFT_302221 [Basidiobolus meristosporus CBS 931.73]